MKKTIPHLGFFTVFVLWGINTTSMKIGGREWDALVFNGLRYLLIIPVLWLYMWFYCRKNGLSMRMKRRDALLILGLGVLSAVGMESSLSYALQYSNSANAAVLGRGFMPVIAAAVSCLLGEIRLTRRLALGIPLAFAGVIAIVAGSGLHVGADTMRGDVVLLARSFLGVVYLIWMNRLVRRYPLPLLLAMEMSAGAAVLLPFVLLKISPAFLQAMPAAGWFSLLYTAFLATLLGFALHNWSLGRLGPFKSAVYGYLLPVTAAVSGYVVLGERLTGHQLLGSALVLAAMYLVQSDRMQTVKRKAAEGVVRDV